MATLVLLGLAVLGVMTGNIGQSLGQGCDGITLVLVEQVLSYLMECGKYILLHHVKSLQHAFSILLDHIIVIWRLDVLKLDASLPLDVLNPTSCLLVVEGDADSGVASTSSST